MIKAECLNKKTQHQNKNQLSDNSRTMSFIVYTYLFINNVYIFKFIFSLEHWLTLSASSINLIHSSRRFSTSSTSLRGKHKLYSLQSRKYVVILFWLTCSNVMGRSTKWTLIKIVCKKKNNTTVYLVHEKCQWWLRCHSWEIQFFGLVLS